MPRPFCGSAAAASRTKDSTLTLEVFADLPDYKLIVCGPIEAQYERQFVAAYENELFHQQNIEAIGWIDVSSDRFKEVVNRCVGLVYPTASEGQSGAVITCMQAGLIPLVSRECGVDVHQFGKVFPDCKIATLRETIIKISEEPIEALKKRAQESWKYARSRHTTDAYQSEYRQMIESILEDQSR